MISTNLGMHIAYANLIQFNIKKITFYLWKYWSVCFVSKLCL